MSSRRWADQRGFTLPELLVAVVVGAVVLLGVYSLYGATTTSFNQSSSQAFLQRQGTLALQEIARQVQRASAPDPLVTCPPGGPAGALKVTVRAPAPGPQIGTYCYYSAANVVGDTTLKEQFIQGGSITTRDLLWPYGYNPTGVGSGLIRQTGKKGVFLLSQTSPADPRCPTGLTTGQPCLTFPTVPATTVNVIFAITDGLNGISFKVSLKQRNS